MASLHGPIEVTITCDCGAEIVVSDEWETTCPACGLTFCLYVALRRILRTPNPEWP